MKLALDVHGVIDSNYKAFSELTTALVDAGNEVHLLTGVTISDKLIGELKEHGIKYTHLFSITDFHKSKGTKIEYEDPNNPWMEAYDWDKTKAEYCQEHKIDLCIDDSDVYSYFFKTPYARYFSKDSHRVKKTRL